jgi:hypothetical protein
MKLDKGMIRTLAEGLVERCDEEDWDKALNKMRKAYRKMRVRFTEDDIDEIKMRAKAQLASESFSDDSGMVLE